MDTRGTIVIKFITDSDDTNTAYGAVVSLDGKVILNRPPHADNMGVDDYTPQELLVLLLQRLGYKVTAEECYTYSGDEHYDEDSNY